MGAEFPHPETLINLKMIDGEIFPRELHDFMYPHFAIPHPMSCVIGYKLSGDVPKGLKVDILGVISGKIKHFGEQSSCTDNNPDGKPGLEGKDWKNNGRFKKEKFVFEFSIEAKWLEHISTPNGPVPCVKPGSTKQNCKITVIKDHNIDNALFMKKYTEDNPMGENANPGPLQEV